MNLIEKLDMLKQKSGDTNASLARKSGIPYTTIDGLYKRGYEHMYLSTLLTLCDYFSVSLDYLARDSENDFVGTYFDENEKALIKIYRVLNADGQEALIEQAEFLQSKEKYTNKPNTKKLG